MNVEKQIACTARKITSQEKKCIEYKKELYIINIMEEKCYAFEAKTILGYIKKNICAAAAKDIMR